MTTCMWHEGRMNGMNDLFERIKGSGKDNVYIFENAIMKPITLYVDLYSQ